MIGRCFILSVLVFLNGTCLAQQSYQLDKKQKMELKALQKEGWQAIDSGTDMEAQYIKWHQIESEQNKDATNKYIIRTSEIESANLQIAERRAWDEACAAIRRTNNTNIKASVKTTESAGVNNDDNGASHSEVTATQRNKTIYTGTMNDIIKVMSIYKKTQNGYKVRIVVAKENK